MNEIIRHLEACSGYITLGMYEDAWNELESIPPELRAKVDVIELRLEIYQALGKWESARVLAESMVKRDPENPNWWIAWAYSLRREKSIGEAREVLQEAALRHPGVALIQYNLACYACVLGEVKEAHRLLTIAFAIDTTLKKIALDDPDLDNIFGEMTSQVGHVFANRNRPELN